MLELYQAEWCPYSHVVRERLTELGVDVVVRQVAPRPEERDAMQEAVGSNSIPVLVTDDGQTLTETDEIMAFLDERYGSSEWERGHQAQERAHPPLHQGASRDR